jgi:transaldolase
MSLSFCSLFFILMMMIFVGASFRNVDEILQLAGCDKLTIAPSLLQELQTSTVEVARKLTPPTEEQRKQQQGSLNKIAVDEASFRFALNEDQMATEKLSEGIRGFSSDLRKLEEIVLKKLNARKQH